MLRFHWIKSTLNGVLSFYLRNLKKFDIINIENESWRFYSMMFYDAGTDCFQMDGWEKME